MAPASAGTPRLRRLVSSPANITDPMAVARSTLGSGLARTTNPTRASTATMTRARRSRPAEIASQSALPVTIATFAPLTAVRWVRPAARRFGLDGRGQQRGVAQDQRGEQTARSLGPVRHRGAQAAAHPLGGPPPPRGSGQLPRRAESPQQRRHLITRLTRHETAGQLNKGADPHPLPRRVADHQHGGVH